MSYGPASRADSETNRAKFVRIDALVNELKMLATRKDKYGECILRLTYVDGTIRKVAKEVIETEQ